MGISRSGYGVLEGIGGDHLGILVSGYGDLGLLGRRSEPNSPLVVAVTAGALRSSPKELTVAAAGPGGWNAGSPKSLTFVLACC